MRALPGAFVLCALLTAFPHGGAAQGTGAVAGRVTDSDGRSLPDVLVFVDDGAATVLTDSLGLFGLSGLTFEGHVLGYRRAGYAPRSFALDLSSGGELLDVGTVVLQPGPEPTANLSGRVTEGEGGPGLAGATIAVNGLVVAVTDSSGAFLAPSSAVVWGTNELTVEHRAFSDRAVTDRVWVSTLGETLDLEVALDVVPVALPGLEVGVPSQRLAAEGFYERREQFESATFLTRDEIMERNPRRTDDLLRGALNGSGMTRVIRQSNPVLGPAGSNQPAQSFGRAEEGKPCLPIFYLNGVRMGEFPEGLDRYVHPDQIEGIEIYESISRMPAQYAPVGSVCGVLLIWTRLGN